VTGVRIYEVRAVLTALRKFRNIYIHPIKSNTYLNSKKCLHFSDVKKIFRLQRGTYI